MYSPWHRRAAAVACLRSCRLLATGLLTLTLQAPSSSRLALLRSRCSMGGEWACRHSMPSAAPSAMLHAQGLGLRQRTARQSFCEPPHQLQHCGPSCHQPQPAPCPPCRGCPDLEARAAASGPTTPCVPRPGSQALAPDALAPGESGSGGWVGGSLGQQVRQGAIGAVLCSQRDQRHGTPAQSVCVGGTLRETR